MLKGALEGGEKKNNHFSDKGYLSVIFYLPFFFFFFLKTRTVHLLSLHCSSVEIEGRAREESYFLLVLLTLHIWDQRCFWESYLDTCPGPELL